MNNKPVVLITGASAGIGRELAIKFAQNGYNLVLTARDKGKLSALAKQLKPLCEVLIIPADLSISGQGKKIYSEIVKKKIQVDILINNAGYGSNGEFVKLNLQSELGMIDLNIRALTELAHLFGGQMASRRAGIILNVASTAAFQPGPFMAVYYATKAYVLSFSQALHEEMKKYDVKVSVLCPGPTSTEFTSRAEMGKSRLFTGPLKNVMSAEQVAEIAYQGLRKGKLVIIPGFLNVLMAMSVRFSPAFLVRKIAAWLNKSQS